MKILFLSILFVNIFYFILQIILRNKYYSYKNKNFKFPKITVIVPAYNQGKHVQKTLESLLNSNFQKQKLQIIAVNDGSIDDTLQYMQKVKNIQIINLTQNKRKKKCNFLGI